MILFTQLQHLDGEMVLIESVPPHLWEDYKIRNDLISCSIDLCVMCDGTGNISNGYLFRYSKCTECEGTGIF